MNKLGRLTKNELLKKFKQTGTIVLSLIFIGFCLLIPILTKIDLYNGDYNSIEPRISNIEFQLEQAQSIEDNELGIGQYEEILDMYKKAMEYGVSSYDDWRYSLLYTLEDLTASRYEVEIILEGKLDPEEEFNKSARIGVIKNASGLLGSKRPSDEDLNKMLDEIKSQIDEYWRIIKTNDYFYLYNQQLEQQQLKKESYESQLAELNQIGSLSDDQKRDVFYLENQLEETNTKIKVYNYCIDNSIEPDSWQYKTLETIANKSSSISSLKLEIYDMENGTVNDDEDVYYDPLMRLDYDEESELKIAKERLEDYENQNLVYWKSVENDTPVIEISDSTRSKSLSYLGMTMFAAIIALFIASNIVSSEFSRKTINMLVIRPVKRWKIITSKYIASLITSYAIYLVGLIVFVIVNGVCFGFSDLAYPYIYASGGEAHTVNFLLYILGQAMFCSVSIIFMVTIAFMMSTLAKNTALAGITSMGVYIGGGIIYSIILYTVENSINFLKYTFLPYIDLSQFAGNIETYYGTNTLLMPDYGAWHLLVLSAIMFAISLIVFNKRDIKG